MTLLRRIRLQTTTALLCLLISLSCFAFVQESARGTLTVEITGARNAKGKMLVWLFKDGQGYPNDTSKIYRQQYVEIDPKTLSAHAIFRDVPQGSYAASVLHDENVNGKLDKSFIGMPKEGYGNSNNPKKKMHAPTYDEVKFSLNATEKNVVISLIYW